MFVVETFQHQNEKDKEFVKVFNGTFCVSFKTNSLKRRPFYINFTFVKYLAFEWLKDQQIYQ